MRSNRRIALVEIGVVIAVIGLLACMMLPALGRSRENSRRTVCLFNTKQMSQGVQKYIAEWSELITLDQAGPNETGDWMLALDSYVLGEKVRVCPTASGSPQKPGTATNQWSWKAGKRVVTGAYAFNGWLYNPVRLENEKPSIMPGHDLDVENPNLANFYKSPMAGSTVNIPVIADAIWVEAFPESTDFVADLQIGTYTSDADQLGRIAINRHSMTVDVAFLDGHSENTPLQNLWTLPWHVDWKTPAVLPPVLPTGQ